jgi:hypothetical protein
MDHTLQNCIYKLHNNIAAYNAIPLQHIYISSQKFACDLIQLSKWNLNIIDTFMACLCFYANFNTVSIFLPFYHICNFVNILCTFLIIFVIL